MGSGSSKNKPTGPEPPRSTPPPQPQSTSSRPPDTTETSNQKPTKSDPPATGTNPPSQTSDVSANTNKSIGKPPDQSSAKSSERVTAPSSSATQDTDKSNGKQLNDSSAKSSERVVSPGSSSSTPAASAEPLVQGSGDATPTLETLPPAPEISQSGDGKSTKVAMAAEGRERVLPAEPEPQRKFDTALRTTNALVRAESLLGEVNKGVCRLALKRKLPDHVSIGSLVSKLDNLQVLDVSGNNLGPQAVRALCLGLPPSSSIASLCIADNKTDTDSADSIGRLLTQGPALAYLDVSGNYLGKDFFSRCAGTALKTNTCLQTLRAQSIGMVDAGALLDGLQANTTLVDLDLGNNQLTDRKILGSSLGNILQKPDCILQSLALPGCNMNAEGLVLLVEGLAANTSLHAINLNNNEFGSLQTLLQLVATAISHPALQNLSANDARIQDASLQELPKSSGEALSKLQVLSLNSSNVNDEFFRHLTSSFKGRLLNLVDIDISNNQKITASAVESIWNLTADNGQSNLCKLTTAMDEMSGLPALLTAEKLPSLSYLNVRKARFTPDAFTALAEAVTSPGLSVKTLVLDGMKLSGKKGLPILFDRCSSSNISALSLSGCSLTDADLSPLTSALGSGFKVHMVKLSDNRLTDATLKGVAEGLQRSASHPLSVLDVSGNQMTDAGVRDLCGVYTSKNHTSSLHSLNLATNSMGKEGVLCLLSCMGGKFPLKCLYVNHQRASFLESDIDEIHSKALSSLGYTVKKAGEVIEAGCSNLPSLPEGMSVNMRGLGGHSGQFGPFLDCPAVLTDSSTKRPVNVTLENIFDICCSLQEQKEGKCVLSSSDWTHVIGADKDNSIPSWLQLSESRAKGVYLSNLPGNSTSQRLEALFEMEADCNMEEVVLVKDPVTKNNSGVAWVLFSDEASVERAMDFYNSGEAQVFGTPFTVSRIKVTVDEMTAGADSSSKARQDVAARQRARAAEDRAHQRLIQQNTEESWKRHAYRLAHPAYADGRIW